MRLSSAWFITGIVSAFAIASWAKQGSSSPADAVYLPLTKVPPKARNRSNRLERDPEAPIAGRKLFEQHCAECHGSDATGGKRAPSLAARQVQEATPGDLFWILTNGVVRRGMPVWSRLPEPQRWQIVTYLKSLGTSEGAGTSGPAEGAAKFIPPR